jgi:hypothetical protein
MRRTLKSLLVFAGAGLLGPLVWNVVRHPSRMEGFISDLVFLLWPTQPLGVIETSEHRKLSLSRLVRTSSSLQS